MKYTTTTSRKLKEWNDTPAEKGHKWVIIRYNGKRPDGTPKEYIKYCQMPNKGNIEQVAEGLYNQLLSNFPHLAQMSLIR